MKRPVVKSCWLEDIDKLCMLAKEFIEESAWGFTYDEGVTVTQLYEYIVAEEYSRILLVTLDDEPAGAAVLVARQDFSKEKLGFVQKLYIRKQFRRTLAPLYLAKASAEWFDSMDCVESFATSTGNVEGSICSFSKLMGKCGYEDCGPTLSRKGIING